VALAVALVGAGARGREWAREVASAPGWQLAALVDSDPETLARAGVELAVPEAAQFADLASALQERDFDAAIVATPPDQHVSPARLAIDHGLAVLIEKPLAAGLADAVALVELAESREVPLVVGQNLRYTRAHRAVRRVVASGALGRIRMVVCQSYRVPELAGWRRSMGDLVVWEVAVHHLDALRYTIGEIAGVTAEVFSSSPGASVHALVAFENGARGLYCATYESSGHEFFERGQEFYERVVGERGTLHVFQRWLVLCPRGGRPRLVRRGRRAVTEERMLLDQLRAARERGVTPECSGRDNLATVAVAEACARAAGEGRWVDPRELMLAHV
jgi:predicted dehydrogenase